MNIFMPAIAAAILLVTSPAVAIASAQHSVASDPVDRTVAETAATLTMATAVAMALASNDPYLLQPGERAAALDERTIADGQRPDPKLKVEFANWPLDGFSYRQEPMTQIKLGIRQAFPKGDTLMYRQGRRRAQAKGERFQQDLRRREIILDTRQNWLNLYYWTAARGEIQKSRQAVAELIEVIQAIFATGRGTSQDIFRAEMELALLDDRLVEVARQSAIYRAKLARRIGEDAAARRPAGLPPLTHPSPLTALNDLLPRHPAALVLAATVEAADRDVDIAGEQFKPGWSLNVDYGNRGGNRADFASVGILMDMPLFTGKRQARGVAAAKKERQASRLSHHALLLDLRATLHASFVDWQRLQERVSLYQSVVIERARQTTEAARASYQNGVTDFPELVRARLVELDSELMLLRLQTDKLQAQAKLLYFEGEDDA